MKRLPFETQALMGDESVMFVRDLEVSEIRFKHSTKEIFVVHGQTAKYDKEALTAMTWREIKKLILEENGVWISKAQGIADLLEVSL